MSGSFNTILFVLASLSSFYPGNFAGGTFVDLPTSDKICQGTTNYPHLKNVGDGRAFV